MLELLKLCGFEADEINKELPRINKAFTRLGLTPEDVEIGKQRLTKYYDTGLKGVRKMLRLCILEMVNSMLAREDGKEKVIFGLMSPGLDTLGSVLVSNSDSVFSAHLPYAFLLIVGCIFDKSIPVLEAAESKWLKTGMVSHCANVKTFLGLFTLGLMPVPDLMVTAGFSCETAPKTVDLLHELYNIPVCCIDTCQDREFGSYSVDSKRVITLAAKSLRKTIEQVQNIVGFKITEEMFREVLNVRSKFDAAFVRLLQLIEKSDPLPLSATHYTILWTVNALTLDVNGLHEATGVLNTLYDEIKARIDKGTGVVNKGAPRLLGVLPSHHADPRFEHLISEMGMALVTTDLGLSVPFDNISQDPYEVMSSHLQISLATSLPRRIPLIIDACKTLHVDGVINRYHVGCRSVTGDAMLIANALKKELDIPVLTMEWENFDSRVYDHEQYKRRLELFKTMLDSRKSNRSGLLQ